MPNLPQRKQDNAAEIYRNLIVRVRKSVKDRESIVFDPVTGIMKCFLAGKLIWVKYPTKSGVIFDKDQEDDDKSSS